MGIARSDLWVLGRRSSGDFGARGRLVWSELLIGGEAPPRLRSLPWASNVAAPLQVITALLS